MQDIEDSTQSFALPEVNVPECARTETQGIFHYVIIIIVFLD